MSNHAEVMHGRRRKTFVERPCRHLQHLQRNVQPAFAMMTCGTNRDGKRLVLERQFCQRCCVGSLFGLWGQFTPAGVLRHVRVVTPSDRSRPDRCGPVEGLGGLDGALGFSRQTRQKHQVCPALRVWRLSCLPVLSSTDVVGSATIATVETGVTCFHSFHATA